MSERSVLPRTGEEGSNFGRLASAFEKIAEAIADMAEFQREQFNLRFPHLVKKERKKAQINRKSDEKREQYSDRGTPAWHDETQAALPESRFAQRLREGVAEDQRAQGPQKS
jgi:hypothetical protein